MTGRCTRARLFASLAALALATPASAALDCSALTPQSGRLGYSFRKGSDRCEGIYTSPAAGNFELVSLTLGPVSFALDPKAELQVQPANVSTATGTRLIATSIPTGSYYWMEGPMTSAAFRLPLGPVIVPAHINPDALGIYGVRNIGGGRPAYIPVRIGAATQSSSNDILAVFRSDDDVMAAEYRIRTAGATGGEFRPIPGAEGIVSAGRRIEVALSPPENVAMITVEIKYHDVGTSKDVPARSFDVLLK